MTTMSEALAGRVAGLEAWLKGHGRVRVAVSGGVDSLTLAILAGRTLGQAARMFHAVSPAVPAAATARVRETAAREGWRLELVDAGEFRDENYRANPYERCYHCKDHLYTALGGAARSGAEGATVLSGANLDDLADFRPGLRAAEEHGVRHPFVECRVDKAGIRAICHALGYPELAVLPAAPCLSSRIETGLRIEPELLAFIDRVESELRETLNPEVVRCRVRENGVTLQLDPGTLGALTLAESEALKGRVRDLASAPPLPGPIGIEPYRMGSAFVPQPLERATFERIRETTTVPAPDAALGPQAVLDFQREARIGIGEAVLCERKSAAQIAEILLRFQERDTPCLLTRLDADKAAGLPGELNAALDYQPQSRTGFFRGVRRQPGGPPVAIVSGGTSDAPVCLEAARTLQFHGVASVLYQDVGVTGLWRLLERLEEIRRHPLVIAVAGMEGALFSVLGGLVAAPLIAVPTSVGYGVGADGHLGLQAALGSCAPGIVTVNIDNGYGAACAALRILNRHD